MERRTLNIPEIHYNVSNFEIKAIYTYHVLVVYIQLLLLKLRSLRLLLGGWFGRWCKKLDNTSTIVKLHAGCIHVQIPVRAAYLQHHAAQLMHLAFQLLER